MIEYGARCPGCNISFRITAAQRRAAGGLVRCGFCLVPFDANAHGIALTPEPVPSTPPRLRPAADQPLEDRTDADFQARATTAPESPNGADASGPVPPPAAPEPAPEPEPEFEASEIAPPDTSAAPSPPRTPEVAAPPDSAALELAKQELAAPELITPQLAAPEIAAPGAGALEQVAPEQVALEQAALEPAAPERADPVPDAIADAAPPNPAWLQPKAAPVRAWAAVTVTVAAAGALVLQGLYFHADVLDRRPALRDVYGFLCEVVPCRRPAYRDVAAIAVDQLVVRTQAPGALRLDAMLTNRGREAQPLPRVRLQFENLQGVVVAERRFAPGEYLDQPPASTLAVGQSLHLVLELVDPGPEAVSYALVPVD